MAIRLNWKEIENLVRIYRPEIQGLFVERVIVPERPLFPGGYLKGEWALRLTSRSHEGFLLMSVRTGSPYFAWHSSKKGFKLSPQATQSPFDLAVAKNLRGAKLLDCQSIPKERVVIFWFSREGHKESVLGLVLVMIPATPEALLITATSQEKVHPPADGWSILARSKTSRVTTTFRPPNGAEAPLDPPVRSEFLQIVPAFHLFLEKELSLEAFTLRTQIAQKDLRQILKQARDRSRQSMVALREAQHEPDWQKWGDLLKFSLHTSPLIIRGKAQVPNFETGESTEIPIDAKLSLTEQVQKFYLNAKRKHRRIEEARSRQQKLEETLNQIQKGLLQELSSLDWPQLEKLERLSGQPLREGVPSHGRKSPHSKSAGTWLGKTFLSRDQLTIWIGRDRIENLELTFKIARGNDVWMHVRGRPGAHGVVPVQPGKSVPLETLLDAAHLTIYYSGGENWGKTEVDYTFKKYVKRIKDSSEASYTHNKTLLINPDPTRLQRLLQQNVKAATPVRR